MGTIGLFNRVVQVCLLHVLVLVLVEATVCMYVSGRYEVPAQMRDGIGDRMHLAELTAHSPSPPVLYIIHVAAESGNWDRQEGSPSIPSLFFSTLPVVVRDFPILPDGETQRTTPCLCPGQPGWWS